MTEPTIVCPKCNNEIRLTESLAAPLIAATRLQFERQLSEKDADIARREQGVRDREPAPGKSQNDGTLFFPLIYELRRQDFSCLVSVLEIHGDSLGAC